MAEQWVLFFLILFAVPYVIGFPLAVLWVGVALIVRALTGIELLPDNVRSHTKENI